jgi:hypothetical protein
MSREAQLARNEEVMKEQDASLDELSAAIARMKSVSEAIGGELDTHNAILDDLQEGTAAADQAVAKATKGTEEVTEANAAGSMCALS